jgi:ATP-binding protein involved in chromosome partitioning
MSYYVCPQCSDRHRIFGEGGGRELARTLDADFLGEVPIDVRLREGSDDGVPLVVSDPTSPAATALLGIADRLGKHGPSLVGKRLPMLSFGGH